jgi:DNA-binding transcriptional LysR family regulator
LDTRFLDTLAAVVSYGSIAETARQRNLTPAAVAQRIRTLEQEFGTQLIVRSGKTVRPTEKGLAIAKEALALLQHEKRLKALASQDQLRGELRIGAIATAFQGILPDIIANVARNCPDVMFYLLPGTSTELYKHLENEALDLAILIEPRFALSKSMAWQTLREEPLILIVPQDLPEAHPHQIIESQPFIRYDRTQWGGRLVDSYLKSVGLKPQERIELDALDAIAAFVSRGLGVALVPDWAPPWPGGLGIRKISLEDSTFLRRLGIAWRRTSVREQLTGVFVKEAMAQRIGAGKRRKGK